MWQVEWSLKGHDPLYIRSKLLYFRQSYCLHPPILATPQSPRDFLGRLQAEAMLCCTAKLGTCLDESEPDEKGQWVSQICLTLPAAQHCL